jgi:hypothetical protein
MAGEMAGEMADEMADEMVGESTVAGCRGAGDGRECL